MQIAGRPGRCLCRRRRRRRARLAAVAARRQGLPRHRASTAPSPSCRATTREAIACLIVDIRMDGMSGLELQDELIERKVSLPDRLHHRPRRRADGGVDDEEGRDGLHREALQGPGCTEAWSSACSARRAHASPAPASTASRDALLSRLTAREAAGARAHRRRPAEQADRRRPGHQHQDGRGAPRQHHGKAQRQHRGRSAEAPCSRGGRLRQ